jgi:hypothetical protein
LTCEFTGVFEDFILVLPGAGRTAELSSGDVMVSVLVGALSMATPIVFLKLKDKAYFDETFYRLRTLRCSFSTFARKWTRLLER